ncbi:MAG: transposase, partial [Deltaproteobacteria bacterium]|nr:transposase [Deltaproteobacteria bacterium]
MHRSHFNDLLSTHDGMITVDGTYFPKRGKHSPAVGPQYCGNRGKTDNCQSTVALGVTAPGKGYGLFDIRTCVPEKWFHLEDPDVVERRDKVNIPEDLKFQTKNEIAIEMIKSALANGVQASWVGADGAIGHDMKFLDSVPDNLRYFACVHQTDTFFSSMPEMFVPTKKDGPRRKPTKQIFTVPPQSAKDIVNNSDVPCREDTAEGRQEARG